MDDVGMSATNDLIRTTLLPASLPVDIPVNAALRVHNISIRPCTNLVLEFELPQALLLEQGRRLIERERLAPDERYDHHIRLRALQPGPCTVTFPNFSFKDGAGRPRRCRHRIIDIEVQPSYERLDPSAESTYAPPPRPSSAHLAPSVFISYRRSDGRWIAGRLAEGLQRYFPRHHVFLDLPSIPLGEDWQRRLDRELQSCAALLAVIGPQWLSGAAAIGRQIDDEGDVLRHEIAVALKREILVIPVLFDTSMPSAQELPADIRALADRQAKTLDPARFSTDILEIVFALRPVLKPSKGREGVGPG